MSKRIKGSLVYEHVIAAMNELGPDTSNWPRGRLSTKFDVIDPRDGMRYPPKLILSLAIKYLDGAELHLSRHSGGEDTNDQLRRLGFRIEPKSANH